MTYIIGGKKDKKTFLMVDCIATEIIKNEKKETLTVKVNKLKSSNKTSYYCITGPEYCSLCLRILDDWLNHNNTKSDFINNSDDRDKLKKVIKKIAEGRNETRDREVMFVFIDDSDIFCLDLNITLDNEVNETSSFKVKNNHFYSPSISKEVEINTKKNIEFFCKEKIINNISKGEDFRDKFSYIEFDNGKLTEKSPIKNFSDLYAMIFDIPYSEIDNNVWNI